MKKVRPAQTSVLSVSSVVKNPFAFPSVSELGALCVLSDLCVKIRFRAFVPRFQLSAVDCRLSASPKFNYSRTYETPGRGDIPVSWSDHAQSDAFAFSVIPSGMADFFLRSRRANVGHAERDRGEISTSTRVYVLPGELKVWSNPNFFPSPFISSHQFRNGFGEDFCVLVYVGRRRVWAHQGHVVERGQEDAAV
jgi:hypothetical protein